MGYLIVQILWFLIAAAAVGFAAGWLCRTLAIGRDRDAAAARLRRELGETEDQRDRLKAQLAEAIGARKELQESGAETRQAAEAGAASLRKLERDNAATLVKLGAREREVARLSADLEGKRREIAELAAQLDHLRRAHPERAPGAVGKAPLEAMAHIDHPLAEADVDAAPAEISAPDGPGTPPPKLAAPDGPADDLRRISGIGPGIEKTLNDLGIYHYRQIAAFTPQNLAWVNQHLRFKGRIEREDWIGQAKRLLADGLEDAHPPRSAGRAW